MRLLCEQGGLQLESSLNSVLMEKITSYTGFGLAKGIQYTVVLCVLYFSLIAIVR